MIVVWSGSMERSGEAPGLSSHLFRRSIAASCADRGFTRQGNEPQYKRLGGLPDRPCACRCVCKGIVLGREVAQSLKRCLACRRGRTALCKQGGFVR